VRTTLDPLPGALEEAAEGARLLLPDEQVIGHVEGRLHISHKEGVLSVGGVLAVHHREVLGVAVVVLSEGGVLVLPGLLVGELSEIPPVLVALPLLGGHLDLIHDHVLEHAELVRREVLVERYVSGLLHSVEAELGNGSDNLSLGGAAE